MRTISAFHNLHAGALTLILCTMAGLAAGQDAPRSNDVMPERCQSYQKDWREALSRWGSNGLGQEFIDANNAFIASHCRDKIPVCARSPREVELANVLTMRAMMAGRASTFLPFSCEGKAK